MFRKQPRPRSFDYRPRYFDPEKEHSSLRPIKGDDTEVRKQRISRHFRQFNTPGSSRHPGVQRQVRQSNLRLLLILIGLLLLVWWFISGNLGRILALLG